VIFTVDYDQTFAVSVQLYCKVESISYFEYQSQHQECRAFQPRCLQFLFFQLCRDFSNFEAIYLVFELINIELEFHSLNSYYSLKASIVDALLLEVLMKTRTTKINL
jgi:hypothetical protein